MRTIRRFKPVSLITKVLLLAAIAACAVIGLAGLLLPIIPGILFLCLAVLLARQLGRA